MDWGRMPPAPPARGGPPVDDSVEHMSDSDQRYSGLKDKVALVTGSSRGIGAAIAREFARHGAQVVVHGRDVEAMTAVRAGIERDGGRAIQLTADTTSFAELE